MVDTIERNEDPSQVRSVIDFSLNPIRRSTLGLAMSTYFSSTDHFFQSAGNIIESFDKFNIFLSKHHQEYKGKVPNSLNTKMLSELRQLWWASDEYGNARPIFLKQKLSVNGEILQQDLVFEEPKNLSFNQRFFEIPALRYLSPKSDTKDMETNKIMIQAEMPFKIAWDGYDPEYLATVEHFAYEYSDGSIPYYPEDADVMQADEPVTVIGRATYNKLTRILVPNFKMRSYHLEDEMTTCLNKMKNAFAEQNRDISSDILEIDKL